MARGWAMAVARIKIMIRAIASIVADVIMMIKC